MRSEMPWMEPRSPWTRVAPTALALVIIGVGIGGAVRIVRAQDNVPQPATQAPAPDLAQATPPAPAAPAAPTITIAPPSADATDQANNLSAEDKKKLQKELDDLQRQRGQLNGRIDALRAKLGYRSETRLYSVYSNPSEVLTTPRTYVLTAPRALTPEEKKRADEAKLQLDKAMRDYQKAMRDLPPGSTTYGLTLKQLIAPSDVTVVPAIPPVPTPPDVRFFSSQDAKTFDQKSKEFEAQMQEFNARMKVWEQEFRSQMEKWQKEFESRMHQQFRDGDGNVQEGQSEAPKPEQNRPSDPFKANPKGDRGAFLFTPGSTPDPPLNSPAHHSYSSHDAL
jgi:hypothetical protein